MFLEGLWSSGRRALLPAALSLFLAESSTVPHRPGQHPRYVNSDVYYLARLLACSRSVAFLAVLALCYHAQLADLVFIGSFIYDVLCGFFYFAALTYYIHIREKGRSLRSTEFAAFLALYICALNSKEMAVTLPVIVLIYEALRRPRF